MDNIRIEILKDTPFHKKGEQLKLIDFRTAYGWICTNTTTNEQLITYLKTEWKLNQPKEYQKTIREWFEVIELENLEPLSFIFEDIFFTKGFNGMYQGWTSPSHYELHNCNNNVMPVIQLSIPEVRNIIETSKYKKQILYCTNHVNKKL